MVRATLGPGPGHSKTDSFAAPTGKEPGWVDVQDVALTGSGCGVGAPERHTNNNDNHAIPMRWCKRFA
jgi:hypothetical protein